MTPYKNNSKSLKIWGKRVKSSLSSYVAPPFIEGIQIRLSMNIDECLHNEVSKVIINLTIFFVSISGSRVEDSGSFLQISLYRFLV